MITGCNLQHSTVKVATCSVVLHRDITVQHILQHHSESDFSAREQQLLQLLEFRNILQEKIKMAHITSPDEQITADTGT